MGFWEFPPTTTTVLWRWSVDGEIVAAAQEERFSRKKNDASFPVEPCVRFRLAHARYPRPDDIDHVAFYDKPFLKFERLLETYMRLPRVDFHPFATAMPVWIGEKLFQKDLLRRELKISTPRLAEPEAIVCRASFQPCCFGILPFAIRGGRCSDHRRRRRMGDHLGRHRPGARSQQSRRKSSFRIRSGCSTRRLPITPASRSTPASTRSWASPPTANRNIRADNPRPSHRPKAGRIVSGSIWTISTIAPG